MSEDDMSPCRQSPQDMQRTINKLHEQNRELKFRAENPKEPGRADNWQAACGMARSKLVHAEKELAAAHDRIAELDAQLGKRPCQNNRCIELAAARALLREVTKATNFHERLILDGRIRSYLDAAEVLG